MQRPVHGARRTKPQTLQVDVEILGHSMSQEYESIDGQHIDCPLLSAVAALVIGIGRGHQVGAVGLHDPELDGVALHEVQLLAIVHLGPQGEPVGVHLFGHHPDDEVPGLDPEHSRNAIAVEAVLGCGALVTAQAVMPQHGGIRFGHADRLTAHLPLGAFATQVAVDRTVGHVQHDGRVQHPHLEGGSVHRGRIDHLRIIGPGGPAQGGLAEAAGEEERHEAGQHERKTVHEIPYCSRPPWRLLGPRPCVGRCNTKNSITLLQVNVQHYQKNKCLSMQAHVYNSQNF